MTILQDNEPILSHLGKNTAKRKMSDPLCGPKVRDIVANYIFRIARDLSKLNKEINLALLFDICTVIFVCFHAFPLYQIFYYFPLYQHNHH
jgi:hypothetical protein